MPQDGSRQMRARNSIFAELEDTIKSGPRDRRIETPRRPIDPFPDDADRFRPSANPSARRRLVISGRAEVEEVVRDQLSRRGDCEVAPRLAKRTEVTAISAGSGRRHGRCLLTMTRA